MARPPSRAAMRWNVWMSSQRAEVAHLNVAGQAQSSPWHLRRGPRAATFCMPWRVTLSAGKILPADSGF
jgi:hypothetical protein